ncbi:MAG: ribonuclease E/G [Pararhodobacter sp.]|nr:ribonuclease E/G [Pararhodobacter sp.]
MKGTVLALGQIGEREVAALIVDGRLDELALAPDNLAPGAVLRGRAGRPMKGMGGMFVELPGGQRGFLRQTKGIAPGQPVLVQVAGVAEKGKAPPLSLKLAVKGRHAVLTPGAPGLNISRAIRDEAQREGLGRIAAKVMDGADETLGLILRSSCAEAAPEEVAEETASLRALAEAIAADIDGLPELLLAAPDPKERAWRDWPLPDTVDDSPGALDRHGVLAAIEQLLQSELALPGGASMAIEPTRALVAVDVNTGADTSPAAGLKACIAAARELPRQLRLRGLGGLVVIDLAPCPKRDRHVVEQVLRKGFRGEGGDTVLAGWTPLGNFELQRRRDRQPLAEWMQGAAPA